MPGRRERGWSEHEMVKYSGEIRNTILKTRISHDINFHTTSQFVSPMRLDTLPVSHQTEIDWEFFSFALFNLQQSALRLSEIW